MEEKKPLKTKIRKNIEVKPSIEIQIQKQKKILNLILYWYLTAAESFMVRKKIRLIPTKVCMYTRFSVSCVLRTKMKNLVYIPNNSKWQKSI